MLNYWWVTRPKRRLTSIPEVLAAFSNVALASQWQGSVNLHLAFEEELERSGLKRVGERRDRRGSGGRTYQAWLSSLGLVVMQESTGKAFLTLAGEAIMEGKPPVEVLKNQILKYQFPSPFSLSPNSAKNRVSERFKIRPFLFLLKLLSDVRVQYLTQNEIALIVMVEAENETQQCYERVVQRICDFRENGEAVLDDDFITKYAPCSGKVNPDAPYAHLRDVANTMINWLDYAQLISREVGSSIKILEEKREFVRRLLEIRRPFIDRPEEREYFQRKYGLDPWHTKDLRNLTKTKTITSRIVEEQKIRQAFIAASLKRPIRRINADVVCEVVDKTGIDAGLVERVLYERYPNGAIGGFMAEYFELAFKGQEEAVAFEKSTTLIFQEVFGFKATHLGQSGSKSTPDILLLSDEDHYQAIIDNKAYRKYSISGDHHNRMVYNYIKNFSSYSNAASPLAFFSYIAGGFGEQIDGQIQKITNDSGTRGSCISVSNMIRLIENQSRQAYSHKRLREIFSVGRQISLNDI